MDIKVKDIRFQADLAYKINPKLTNLLPMLVMPIHQRTHILEKFNIVGAYEAAHENVQRHRQLLVTVD
jgi:hypothetical protein